MRVFAICICLILPNAVYGLDQVVLKSGVVIEGKVEKKTPETVTVKVIPGGFSMPISRDKISRIIVKGRMVAEQTTANTKTKKTADTERPVAPAKKEVLVPDPENDPDLQVGEAVPEGTMPGEGRYRNIEAFLKLYPEYSEWERIDAPPVYVFYKHKRLKQGKLHTNMRDRAAAMARRLYPKTSKELLKSPIIVVVYESVAKLNEETTGIEAAALYMAQLDYIKLPLPQRQAWTIMRHELLHLMYQRAVGRRYRIPTSLHEGFAVYEEKFQIDSKPVARSGVKATDVSLSKLLRADLTDRGRLGLTIKDYYLLSLDMTRMFLIRRDPATYVKFSREISRIRVAPDELWKKGVGKLLKKHYGFKSIEQAEKIFRAAPQ